MNPTNKRSPGARGVPQPFNQQSGHAPQINPAVAQRQTGAPAQSVKRPVAPPVYRPQATPNAAQPKAASSSRPNNDPLAPPVYKPQPAPKVLQTKKAVGQQSRPVKSPSRPGPRPEPGKIAQPKTAAAHAPVRSQCIQPKLSDESVNLVAVTMFKKDQNLGKQAIFFAIQDAVTASKVSGYEKTQGEKKAIQVAYLKLKEAAAKEAQKQKEAQAAAAQKLKEEQEAAAQKLKEAEDALDNKFTADAHKILTVDWINRYRKSPRYRVRAKQEFDDEGGHGQSKMYHYGVVFEIRKNSTDTVMYTHYHAHHNADYTDVKGHFKVGMSKLAPQSWDLDVNAAGAFTKQLRNSSITEQQWKELS